MPIGRYGSTPPPQPGRKLFGTSSTSRFGISSQTQTPTPTSTPTSTTSTSTPTSTTSTSTSTTPTPSPTPSGFVRSEHWCVKKPKLPSLPSFFKKSSPTPKSTKTSSTQTSGIRRTTSVTLPPPAREPEKEKNAKVQKELEEHWKRYMGTPF